MVDAEGETTVVRKCIELSSEVCDQEVSPDVCNACPVREAAMQRKKEQGADTIPLQEIHQVVNETLHEPKENSSWLPCTSRTMLEVKSSCCEYNYKMFQCNDPDAGTCGEEVMPDICRHCPVRKPPSPE